MQGVSTQLTGATLPVLRLEVGTEGQQRPDGVRVSFLQGGAQGLLVRHRQPVLSGSARAPASSFDPEASQEQTLNKIFGIKSGELRPTVLKILLRHGAVSCGDVTARAWEEDCVPERFSLRLWLQRS